MWTRTAGRLARALRPKARADADVGELVRAKLPLVAEQPAAIGVSVEHGCVVLTGHVSTRERAHVVREIAVVRGVDSVVDLLSEREAGAPGAAAGGDDPRRRAGAERDARDGLGAHGELRARGRRRALSVRVLRAGRALPLARGGWSPRRRLVGAGAGAGLAIAGLRLGGAFGIPLGVAGALLLVRSATDLTLRRGRSAAATESAGASFEAPARDASSGRPGPDPRASPW